VDGDDELLELIRRAQAGDDEAIRVLVDRCKDRVTAIVRWRVDPATLGFQLDDDIVQEVLVYAFRNMKSLEFPSVGAFFHWLSKIAQSRIVDFHRAGRAEKRGGGGVRPFADFRSSSLGISGIAAGGSTPCESAQRREILERLPSAIQSLTPRERDAYDLVDLCKLSRAEAARELGVTESALRAYHARAQAKITDVLGLG
jgi:RNA polymerase sigma factor (sigma-70 family)